MNALTKKYNYVTPLLILAFSFFIRLYFISKGPFHVDCLNLAINSEKTLLTQKIHFMFGSGYPFTVISGAIFVLLFKIVGINDPVLAVNFMSVVFSSLCVLITFKFTEKLFDKKSAILSSMMLSIFPIFLVISVYGKSHTPSLFFLMLGLYFLANYHISNKIKDLMLCGIFLGLMGATRLQDLILMIIPIVYLYFVKPINILKSNPNPIKTKKVLLNLIILGSIAASIIIILHLPLILKQGNNSYINQFSRFWRIGVTTNFMGIISSSLWIGIRNIIFGLTPVGTVLALLGLITLIKKDIRSFFFLLLWFLIPLMFYGNLVSIAPRFLVISAIPLIISQGYFFSLHCKYPKQSFNIGVLIVFSTIFILLFIRIHPILQFRKDHALLPDFGKFINKKTEPNAVIIVSDEGLFVRYYGKREIAYKPRGALTTNKNALYEFKLKIDDFINQGIPVYITSSGLYSYDVEERLLNTLQEEYQLVSYGEVISEDWHKGGTRIRTGKEELFKIVPKD